MLREGALSLAVAQQGFSSLPNHSLTETLYTSSVTGWFGIISSNSLNPTDVIYRFPECTERNNLCCYICTLAGMPSSSVAFALVGKSKTPQAQVAERGQVGVGCSNQMQVTQDQDQGLCALVQAAFNCSISLLLVSYLSSQLNCQAYNEP